MRYLCDPGTTTGEALRQIVWTTGQRMVLPPIDDHPNLSLSALLTQHLEHYAMVVEELSESGPPVVLADYSDELSGGPLLLDPRGRPLSLGAGGGETSQGACSGCTQAPAAGVGGFGLAALWLVGLRRRRTRPLDG
jgi:hypothetical protein